MKEITLQSVKEHIAIAQAHLASAKSLMVSSDVCAKAAVRLASAITALSTGLAGDVDDDAIRKLKGAVELARCQLQDAVCAGGKT